MSILGLEWMGILWFVIGFFGVIIIFKLFEQLLKDDK